jgi:hypothetical protein
MITRSEPITEAGPRSPERGTGARGGTGGFTAAAGGGGVKTDGGALTAGSFSGFFDVKFDNILSILPEPTRLRFPSPSS